ncbi:MSC_0619 family F1-like ATPase alpha subunit [Mycoplasmopsis verecunda]|uniref:F-type H+-transporting ATPase subunit alpha n=1 Tax=Mycoplasmopsis verecunda TaxID=171291 RepID=A0A1T4KMD4_9BACT|nr:ATP F0F1 synthase subunit alpha [Mycoplasmopsis verecunda]WPB54297.1 ATP F0F1 synthase subunit alpha [Mycoplasmopsis verecunda]SJZ43564.1 F-type H+-transporting ATPase subunit alpha [Mycoplasmopsis verecunda]
MSKTIYPKISGIFDYVVEVSGKYPYFQNQVFKLDSNEELNLILISATEGKAYLLAEGKVGDFLVGQSVIPFTSEDKIQTSLRYFGKIIDIKGQVLFPANVKDSDIKLSYTSLAFNKPNDLLSYQPLEQQLNTGYMSIDLLIPIGKGQRELIIGDRKTGKTFLALNTIINQKNKNVKCIYVGIGKQQADIASVYKTLYDNDALDYTIIINASAEQPYDQYLAPYIAMAHAENLSHDNDVLIVFDDLTSHANIYREIALLTNKPVGKEAFPGDMFFAHARLLERSGKFKGRKSITALPILQSVENDITSLVASNDISITDGQIVMNTDLFAQGKLPAIDIDLSVSRIGGAVQKPYIAKVSGKISKIYKAYKRQIKLASLKYDLNDETSSLLKNGSLVEQMFIQKGVSIYSESIMFLTAKLISWGILQNVTNIPKGLKFIEELCEQNEIAKDTLNRMLNNLPYDDKMAKEFFAFALAQYASYKNLDWKVNTTQQFIALDERMLKSIDHKIGDK